MQREKLKILLIEDNDLDAETFVRVSGKINSSDIEVTHVSFLEEAIKYENKGQFQIIMLDLSLPDSEGVENVQILKGEYPETPILVLTGNTDQEVGIKSIRAGASDFLVKGRIDDFSLERSISYSLERHQLQKTIEHQRWKIIESSKYAALGELAAGVSHEINNPLAIIHGKTHQIKRLIKNETLDVEKLTDLNNTISNTVERITEVVKNLRHFTRDGSADAFELAKVKEIIDNAISFYEERLKEKKIDIDIELENPDCEIECRSIQISQAIFNIVNNAYEAVEESTNPWIKINVCTENKDIVISVTDSGNGIDPNIFERVMEPYFTTKDYDKGHGMGLSVSKGMIESHHGTLFIDEKSENTRFVIKLPVSQS